MAIVIEGGQTENLSAKVIAELGFCAVAYPWTLVAAHLKSVREALEALKRSMTIGAPPMILSYSEVCEGVGFNEYWVGLNSNGSFSCNSRYLTDAFQDEEERYKFDDNGLLQSSAQGSDK
jgi:hypothetical protein